MEVLAVPVFCTAIVVMLVVVVPKASLPKAMLAGVAVTVVTAGVAVPERVTSWGEFVALSVTAIFPVRFPAVVGANVGVIVHVAPPASVDGATGQVFIWVKLVLAVIAMVVAVLALVFFTVIAAPVLVESTAVEGKETLVGVAVTVVAPLGVP
jgi:hypothetical protein